MVHMLLQNRKPAQESRGPDPGVKAPEPAPQPEVAATAPVEKPLIAPATVDDVTAVIVNFKTLHLVQQAYESLRKYYDLPIILIDNGSADDSTNWIGEHGGITHTENLGHGPAMHQAISGIQTRYVLTLDSDCIVRGGSWIEQMLTFFDDDPQAYAIGWLRYVDRWSGVPLEWHAHGKPKGARFVPYVHPAVAIYDVKKYRQMQPFVHHGAPALNNMVDAEERGYVVKSFQVFDYVKHLKAGTRRMYSGRWDPRTGEKPHRWRKDADYPI
jgi:glycosyltransferase involved in cell wall biosynthesis